MRYKKIIFSIILIIFVALLIVVVNLVNKSTLISSNDNNVTTNRVTTTSNKTAKNTDNSSKDKLILEDNYFITQLNDIYYNIEDYIGRKIEIQGFPMSYQGYKFVGRYGPGCCTGDVYAYIEYEYNEDLSLTDEKDWLKVIGTIQQGNDGTSDYLYIRATSVEKMIQRGKDTVTN